MVADVLTILSFIVLCMIKLIPVISHMTMHVVIEKEF